jgi:hypothetical protein
MLTVLRVRARVRVMVFNAAFNNISVISVLLVEETGVHGENYQPVMSSQTHYLILCQPVFGLSP